jgi:YbbR domain-containing protein
MKNPLDSLWGTVISGVILTVILFIVVKAAMH